MKIIILGAGFAGLAVTWHLLHESKTGVSIDVYDPKPIGQSTSGLCPGLLHSFIGKQANKSPFADEALFETHQLISSASEEFNHSLILSKGMLRVSMNPEQKASFEKNAGLYPKELELWDPKKCLSAVSGLKMTEDAIGLFVKNALTIDVLSYLQGLWRHCNKLGAILHPTNKIEKSRLEKADVLIFACGSSILSFPFFQDLPLEKVKGHSLRCRWPDNLPPLPFSLNGAGYLVMDPDQTSVTAGTTYEHDFENEDPDPIKAKELIFKKIGQFYPKIQKTEILSCFSGVRVSTPSKLPLLGRYKSKSWFLTGLGSRGLLLHSLMGKYLAQAILSNNLNLIPQQVRFDSAS